MEAGPLQSRLLAADVSGETMPSTDSDAGSMRLAGLPYATPELAREERLATMD